MKLFNHISAYLSGVFTAMLGAIALVVFLSAKGYTVSAPPTRDAELERAKAILIAEVYDAGRESSVWDAVDKPKGRK